MKRKRRLLVCAPEFCGIELEASNKPAPGISRLLHTGPGLLNHLPGLEENKEHKKEPVEQQKAKKRVKLERTADDIEAPRLENEALLQV
eukprot:772572-Pelagomonas_calceolata.AAC.1